MSLALVKHEPVIITLSWSECILAATAGILRRISALKEKRKEPHGPPTKPWDCEIESCGAEKAVAKHFDKYWLAVSHNPHTLPGDVGKIQVRSTTHDDGHLILYERDKNDAPFILVRGSLPTYELTGWCYAREGKLEQYRTTKTTGDGRNKPDSFWVPADVLQPMSEFPRENKWVAE